MRSYVSFFVGLLAVQQAAATSWGDCNKLPTCSGACNQCSDQQKSGLDFNKAPSGPISSYGGFKVGGSTCGSFNGGGSKKLAVRGSKLARNGVEEKCAQGPASKSSGPSISCGSDQKPFSANQYQVSVDKDTDLHCVYGYDNGQQCHHTVSCTAGAPNMIQNTQCGNATSVQFQLPPNSPHEECNVGIHQVGFDCTPCNTPPGPSNSLPVPSVPVPSVPVSIPSVPVSVPSVPVSIPSVPVSSPSVPYPSIPLSSPPASVPSVPGSPSVPVPLSTGPAPVPSVPASSSPVPSASLPNSPQTPPAPGTTVPVLTTEIVYTTVTSCPVTTTHTNGNISSVETYQTVSTVKITSTKTVCTKCVAPPKTPESSPPPASTPNSPQSPPAPPPESSAPVSSAPAPSAPASTPNSPEQPSPSVSAPPGTTQEVVTTEVLYTTVTSCPVTAVVTSGGVPQTVVTQSASTVISTSIVTVCTKCVAPPASSAPANTPNSPQQPTSAPVVESSAPAGPAPSAPGVLPSCLKTWIQLTNCKDNADTDCFCKDSSFTNSVQQCVSSWANGQADEQAALSYLAGICAPHVAQNPGIVANVPSTVTLMPTPPATNIPGAPVTSAPASVANSPQQPTSAPAGAPTPGPTAGPVTTISISTTVTLPCPSANAAVSQITDGQIQAPTSMAPGACTTTSVVNTAVTVPQVYLSSGPSATSLAAGVPAPAVASATPANSVAAAAGVASGTGSAPPVPTSTQQGAQAFTGAAGKVEGSLFVSIAIAALGLVILV